jgi:hypothetical protein
MPEINSVQKTAMAAGTKLLPSTHGKVRCLYFSTPATAAWAQNDTFASGVILPKGSRILPSSYVSNSAFGSSVTADVGLRNAVTGVEIDLDGIADGIDIAAAGRQVLNSGLLVAGGVDSVTTADAEVVVTLLSADPTNDADMAVYIFYMCND